MTSESPAQDQNMTATADEQSPRKGLLFLKIFAGLALVWVPILGFVGFERAPLKCIFPPDEKVDPTVCVAALDKVPSKGLLHEMMLYKAVQAYRTSEQVPQAIALLKRDIERGVASDKTLLSLGELYQGTGDYDAAAEAFLKLHRAHPDNIGFWSSALMALSGASRIDELKTVAQAFVDKHPKDAEAWAWLGWAYNSIDEYKQAAAQYEKAYSLAPATADYALSQGWNLEKAGENNQALELYGKAIALAPTTDNISYRLNLYQTLNRPDDVIADYELTVKNDNSSENRINFARHLITNSKYDRAKTLLKTVLSEDPQNYSGMQLLLRAHIFAHEFDQAKSQLIAFRKLENSADDADYWAAALEDEMGHEVEAIKGYKALMERQPSWSELKTDIGHSLIEAGNPQAALHWFDESIAEYEENSYNYSARARAYNALHLPKAALADADEAIRLDPRNGIGFARRGEALVLLEKWQEAEKAYAQAIKIEPGFQWIRDNYADTLDKLGRSDEAKTVRAKQG